MQRESAIALRISGSSAGKMEEQRSFFKKDPETRILFQENLILYIYDHPVEIDRLTLQKEEVEEVQWFDLEETYQQCRQHRDKFCVPLGGLQLVREFIKNNNNNEYKGEKQS